MDKKRFYLQMHANMDVVKKYNSHIEGDFACPLCMRPIYETDIMNVLTEEHVPQKSLGGKGVTLTCKNCNSNCGSEIDIHLLNMVISAENRRFIPQTKRRVYIEEPGGLFLNADIIVEADGTMKMGVGRKINNPKTMTYFHDNVLHPEAIVDIKEKPLKKDMDRINAALIKNAYLQLFVKTGYSFLGDVYYDKLRKLIINPEKHLCSGRLWTIQKIRLQDGVYLSQDNRYRGFFIIYTLKLHLEYNVCVFVPTPLVPLHVAVFQLGEIRSGSGIVLKKLPELNYLEDETAIKKLREWCYGWGMDL